MRCIGMYLWFLWITFLDHQYSFLWQGNYSVLKSPDEYTVNVESSRGTKEFQFDAIFMEDSTQEKIFEDTNVNNHYQEICFKIWFLNKNNFNLLMKLKFWCQSTFLLYICRTWSSQLWMATTSASLRTDRQEVERPSPW